ncbi:membrane protein [Streptomyces capparidis]
MNQAARHIGKTIALVLPVVLVLSGTLAVTRVTWTPTGSDTQSLTASAGGGHLSADSARGASAPEVLRDQLLRELQTEDPGVALTHLQREVNRRPSLARYCHSIARFLGRAAVDKYDGDVRRAQSWSRPVCDTSFASGVVSAG